MIGNNNCNSELNENPALLAQYREQAAALVAQMTPEEKVSQTLYKAPAIERLGIPAYNWWNEALHGVARAGTATVFPQAIGLAATFDEALAERVGDAVSTEGRAKFNMQTKTEDRDIYKGLTFWAPNVNIFRDPRWGRGHETFGEDPYLTSRMGVRYVRGLQGHNRKYLKAAACAKHFAVHSGPEDLRHRFDAQVSEQDLRETYLPAFKACVEEGHVETVMGAYNRTNGVPCCGHHRLLQEVLRGEWGFQGHVVSDCWAIQDFHTGHFVTDTAVDSAAMAMNNGCDLNCGEIYQNLLVALKDGKIDMARLDEALINLFTSRIKLGTIPGAEDNPYDQISYEAVDDREMRRLNVEAARKTLVLLKNEGHLLPLTDYKGKTIGVIGPNADNRKALIGNYEGTASRYITVLEGIQDYVGEDARVLYSEGCHLFKDRVQGLGEANDRISEVKEICRLSDVVIACMGLDPGLEGEEGDQGNEFASGDKPGLELPGLQNEVLRTIIDSGKPAVLLLLSGSALAVNLAQEKIPAIMQCWYPGARGGQAIADVLFGDASPEGRLPVTFYKSTDDLPEFTDYSMEGRTYRYMTKEALYPFGYGLSYDDYYYEKAQITGCGKGDAGTVSVEKLLQGDRITCTYLLRRGEQFEKCAVETTEVYVQVIPDEDTKHLPNYSLRKIIKTALNPGERKEAEFELSADDLMLFDENGERKLFGGEYRIYVGSCGPDKRSAALCGREPLCIRFRL